VNAGHERFKGWEVQLTALPKRVPGLSLSGGYAWHDPRFVEFTFVTPGGALRNVSGNLIELAPRLLWNARVGYAHARGPGAWVAYRHQGERALNRRNTFFTDAFDEWDAGVSYEVQRVRVTVVGRNLGDSRHYVGESEIGDAAVLRGAEPAVRGAGHAAVLRFTSVE
jgi:outer membrane receptor protein involved in Fe transport